MDRRSFLRGASACAVAAVLPMPALADVAPVMWSRVVTPPIFEGSISTYQGVIIRETYDLNACSRQTLMGWIGKRPASAVMSTDVVAEAKRLAATCHSGIRQYGVVTSTVLEGVEVDGGP